MIALALAVLVLVSAGIAGLMIRRGVLDIPGQRSSHDRPTPKGGGLGIAAAFLLGLASAWADGLLPGQGEGAACLLAASLLIASVAWADDVAQFGFVPKLAGQLGAALLLILGGLTITTIGPFRLGLFATPVTLAWLLFAINAVNFIDGLNGLASGCALITAVAVADVTLRAGDPLPAAALLPLAAGIAGFLPFNYPRARIFMGDVGSQLCGLVVAAMAGPASRLSGHRWGAVLVPLALAPILADVVFTLVRRWRAGERLTQAHRGHVYQVAHRAGLPAAQITLVFWALTLMSTRLGEIASRGPLARVAGVVVAVTLPLVLCAVLVARTAQRARLGRW